VVKSHGIKRHYQVLLDPHRSALLDALAAKHGVKAAAFARELVYAGLQRCGEAAYDEAHELDKEARQAAVRRQVEGRMKG
jgi:hypothetical protein